MQASPDIITVESEATAIADAFRQVRVPCDASGRFVKPSAGSNPSLAQQFVAVHQALLNILIGKAGLFNTVPLIGTPVATALRGVEGVVDVRLLSQISLQVNSQR